MRDDNVLLVNEEQLRNDQKRKSKENPFAGRDFFTGSDRLINTTLHEFGHLVYNTIRGRSSSRCKEAVRSIKVLFFSAFSSGEVLEGLENEREWFADNYALWRMDRIHLLPKKHGKKLLKIFKQLKELK